MASLSATKAGTTKTLHAGVQVVHVDYTCTASLSAGDTITLCGIPKGATVLNVDMAGGSGACTVDVGDSIDDNRYHTATSASAALVRTRSTLLTGMNYEYTADDSLLVTVDAVATGTATGTFKFSIEYSMDQT